MSVDVKSEGEYILLHSISVLLACYVQALSNRLLFFSVWLVLHRHMGIAALSRLLALALS